ncbi:Phospholipase A2 (platelet-activating factor acetylhydrolase in humans) [Ceraceosorus bombacis]|uniref:Putative phospholipase n=1 Tax=Ceraceosorus bombacis TaxID=401625 RepID=A0A0P1BN05_9BASI|nr:Phospholipase A2 (platelet-activating factor acetylhydrolase in humans) [Ceraceosorus bombacis]
MPLAAPVGRFAVSTLDLEVPAREARVFGDGFKLNGKPAFRLDTVLITLFYPCRDSEKGRATSIKGAGWLNAPRMKSVEGLLKYAGMSKHLALPSILPAYAVFFAKLPFTENAPLAGPSSLAETATTPSGNTSDARTTFPIGVFSHGLGGTRTTYSSYLSALASEGFVVAAVEHRDLTAPSTQVFPPAETFLGAKQQSYTSIYSKHDEMDKSPTTGEPEGGDVWAMRKAQLELRQAEMLEALHVLKQLNVGEGEQLSLSSMRGGAKERTAAELPKWQGRLGVDQPWALGHSYGAGTCIEAIRKADSPFARSLILDPWVEPIPKASADSSMSIKRPLYVINSEAFTIWRSHMQDVRELVSDAKRNAGSAWLLTLTGSKHTDFSDFPFLLPRLFSSSVPPADAMKIFAKATCAQFAASHQDQDGSDASRSEEAFFESTTPKPREELPGEVENKQLGPPGVLIRHTLSVAKEQTPHL